MSDLELQYTRIAGFEHLYLEDSYVLDLVARPGRFTVTAEIVLTAEHPDYRPPGVDEQYCFRRGHIEFASVRRLTWSGQGAPPAIDASGTVDYGTIDALRRVGGVTYLEGDFGMVQVESAAPTVILE